MKMSDSPIPNESLASQEYRDSLQKLQSEIAQIIVGQEEVVKQLCIAILAKGHAILVGVPGLAKTLLVRSLAEAINLDFSRIQFTPDLMPADITGSEVLHSDPATGERTFKFISGPIFGNIILADEINRTPPKTQAALLEAMQEQQVTVGGKTIELPNPFFVLATQNPIEQEGTYSLPEAALDRFLFLIQVDYPSADQELEIMRRTTQENEVKLNNILNIEELTKMQKLVQQVPIADTVMQYAVSLVRNSRPGEDSSEFIIKHLNWGAGPRAAQAMILAAKAYALLEGKNHVSCADIDWVAKPSLRHRISLNFAAISEGLHPDYIIDELIKATPKHQEN
jgi:MoxR-like ATPase